MSVINTNTKALFSQQALKTSGREMSKAMEQLSTGKRINTAGDDAAGLAISTRMTQQIRALNQAVRNAGDAISLIQTAEGATNEITDMLQRMRELAIQAINDTNSNEDRSYLDLEFQQLKKEIVRISDMTEWNGFKVLNGSAGEPVGEKPVYKSTSNSVFDEVFISPTTFRDISGDDAGQLQTIAFGASTTAGTVTVDGIEIDLPAGGVSAGAVAQLVANALLGSDEYEAQSGRTVEVDGDTVLIRYAPGEDEVSDSTFSAGIVLSTASLFGTAAAVSTTESAIGSTREAFNANGAFLKSGSLSIDVTVGGSGTAAVAASFLGNDGITTVMTGTFDSASGTVSFAASGENTKIISDMLTYTFLDPDGDAMTSTASMDLEGRAFSLDISVEGSVGPLRSGDLIINGVVIGDSYVTDDDISPPNNASGSAIAIAAAINRKMDATGVHAVVNENVMTGSAMSATSAVEGYVVVNGYTSPLIETTLNNTRESRATVVQAINFISHLTGVTAVDTGVDREGVKLVAADGRNIEVTFSGLTGVSDATFEARTGLKSGVQAGTYSLESRVEAPITIGTTVTFDIGRARLTEGDYTANRSELVTGTRAVVADEDDIVPLNQGDLVMNGVAIRSTTEADDTVSSTVAATSSKQASAIAIAAAINSATPTTGVQATAVPARIEGLLTERTSGQSGLKDLFLNGIAVSVDFSEGTTAGERADEVVEKINLTTGQHGVRAEKNDAGGVVLETIDGRNLSVWFNSSSLNAADFGLATTSAATAADGVSPIASATVASTSASTVYGRIKLTSIPPQLPTLPPGTSSVASAPSSPPISIEVGVNGFSATSNFTSLGFSEMTFGGEVDEAVSKMTPPRTGRLAFQVGASASQLITIDLADFGKGGPITSEITGDVDETGDGVRNRINSRDSATAVLANLDTVMDRVNANRANMGAVMNRLTHAMDNLSNVSTNQSASRSQIEDADYAKASTELARTQIMQQAATAVLAQANMSQQTVLQLLQG
jgi:flagellin